MICLEFGGFPKNRGYHFLGGPYKKDYSLSGATMRSPVLGNYDIPLHNPQTLVVSIVFSIIII